MNTIIYIDRASGEKSEERVYGESFVNFLYGSKKLSRVFGAPLASFLARFPLVSSFYGYLQSLPHSVKKIKPFVQAFNVDTSEFREEIASFKSFNDFFTRRLKPSSRPINSDPNRAVIPADGRYFFYPNIHAANGFAVKGRKFDLTRLLKSQSLAEKYSQGSMVIARLCPTDYHRYHFPCDCVPSETTEINGWLHSVNPLAIRQNINIFVENKRTICTLDTKNFGQVLFIEVGAVLVGSIHQTYTPFQSYSKGDEKGFFSFGGSSLILLFPPNRIEFDKDLLEASKNYLEIRCLMGQSMGLKI